MPKSSDFTPRDFFQLAREIAEHEAELKIRLAKAGVNEGESRTRESQMSSTSRP